MKSKEDGVNVSFILKKLFVCLSIWLEKKVRNELLRKVGFDNIKEYIN